MSYRWDADNRRFVTRTHCPWADCGQPTEPVYQGGLGGWCEACARPYESILLPPAQGGAPAEWTVRPTSVFNTFTGQAITGYSPVDWSEVGGAPDRSGCADDPRGGVFGRPSNARAWGLQPAWSLLSIAPEEQNRVGDAVVALAVMRGRVLAVSERGRIALVDPYSGAPQTRQPLDWPGFPTPNADSPVSFAPVVRGSRVVVSSPAQVLFRDLGPQLRASGAGRGVQAWRLLSPSSPDRRFVGPALGLDTPRGPAVALVEAERQARSGLTGAELRFFEMDGRPLGRCSCQGLVRPPLFDTLGQQLIWVDGAGFVHRLPTTDLEHPEPLPGLPTDPLLPLSPSLHPTFALAPSGAGSLELWVGQVERDGSLVLARADLKLAQSRGEVRWIRRSVGVRGGLRSLSVGRGPFHQQNVAGQLLAVSTDQGVLSFPKDLIDAMEHQAARGHETADLRGSWDQPVICSAGVLARVQGRLHLMGEGLPWGRSEGQASALPVAYRRAGGLVLHGRTVIYGVAMGLAAHRLVEEEGA